MTTAAPAVNDLSLATVLHLSHHDPMELLARMSSGLESADDDTRDRAWSFMVAGVEIGGKTALGLAQEYGLTMAVVALKTLAGMPVPMDAAKRHPSLSV